jgi:hypothetical protein
MSFQEPISGNFHVPAKGALTTKKNPKLVREIPSVIEQADRDFLATRRPLNNEIEIAIRIPNRGNYMASRASADQLWLWYN